MSLNVRTRVAVFKEDMFAMVKMSVEIGLMKGTAVSDSYRCLFAY